MRQVAECKASSMINQCYITIFQCILFFGGIKNNWREIRAWCAQKNCSDDRHLERELSVNYTLKPEQVKGWKALNNYSTCLVDWRTKCSSVIANKPFICFPSIWNATPTFSGFEKMSFWHRDYKACIFKSDGCYNSHKKQGKSIVFFLYWLNWLVMWLPKDGVTNPAFTFCTPRQLATKYPCTNANLSCKRVLYSKVY